MYNIIIRIKAAAVCALLLILCVLCACAEGESAGPSGEYSPITAAESTAAAAAEASLPERDNGDEANEADEADETDETEPPFYTPLPETAEGDTFLGIPLIDHDKYIYDICARLDETRGGGLLKFVFYNGTVLPFASSELTFYKPAEENIDWALDSVSFGCAEPDVRVAFVDMLAIEFCDTPEEAVRSGENFCFVAYTDSEYTLYRLVFTGLPVLSLDRRSSELTMLDTEGRLTRTRMTMRERGGSSRTFPKKGYKVNTLDEWDKKLNVNLLDMRLDDDWIIIAVYSDESKLRDKLSYDLWRDMGYEDGVKMEFVELILDGRYWGLYGLVTPMDKKQLDIGPNDILAKIESWDIPSLSELRSAGDAVSSKSIVIKKPDDMTQAKWDVVAEYVNAGYIADNKTLSGMVSSGGNSFLDTDNIIDYWIFTNFISGEDNTWKNMHVFFRHSGAGYNVTISPWDCDLSFGVTWDANSPLLWKRVFHLSKERLRFTLGNRLVDNDIDGAQEKLARRWRELRHGVLSDIRFGDRVDELNELLIGSGAWERDTVKWPSGGHSDEGANYIKEFAAAKAAWLDEYVRFGK